MTETIPIEFVKYLIGGMAIAISSLAGVIFYLLRYLLTKYPEMIKIHHELVDNLKRVLE